MAVLTGQHQSIGGHQATVDLLARRVVDVGEEFAFVVDQDHFTARRVNNNTGFVNYPSVTCVVIGKLEV